MKKTYINPQTTFVHVETTGMMALSIVEGQDAVKGNEVLVKEDKTNSSASYNVWDEDWSK